MWNTFRTNFLAIWNPVWQWTRTHNRLAALGLVIFMILLSLLGLRSCSSPPVVSGSATPETGHFFWKVVFIALLLIAYGGYRQAAIHNRTNIRFPFWAFYGAGMVGLILIGTINIIDLAILGLLLICFFFWTKSDGRMKSFLGFISGLLVVFWMFLIYLNHSAKINIGFLGKLFPDDISKILFSLFVAIFIFAIWRQSKFYYLISFIVFLSFLGNTVIDQIASRYPEKLKPSIPVSIKPTTNKIGEVLEKTIDAFATRKKADAEREALSARKYDQTRRIWEVPAGKTLVYECSLNQCKPAYYMQYSRLTKVISLGNSRDINGIIYEEVSLPDPVTDQLGKYKFFIPAEKLLEKSASKQDKEGEIVYVHIFNRSNIYSDIHKLDRGKYRVEPKAQIALHDDWGVDSYREVETFSVSKEQYANIFFDLRGKTSQEVKIKKLK